LCVATAAVSQKSEVCRSGADSKREAVFGGIKRYQDEIAHINDKAGLIGLLKENMKWAEDTIAAFGDAGLQETSTRLDGAKAQRFELINFMIEHEMYHCGQIAVYERLLGTEPALTARFKKVIAEAAQ
jgi:uncharacterized damage-inducible protein DinB